MDPPESVTVTTPLAPSAPAANDAPVVAPVVPASFESHWVTLEEACSYASVRERTIYRWASDGIVRVVKAPGSGPTGPNLYNLADIEAKRSEREDSEQGGAAARLAAMMVGLHQQGLRQQLGHNATLVNQLVSNGDRLNQHQFREIDRQAARIVALEKELDELRRREQVFRTAEFAQKLEEKKLDAELASKAKAWDFARGVAPQILALVSSNLQPANPAPVDAGVAGWLRSLSPEQVAQLSPLLGEHAPRAYQLLQAGKQGDLSAWLRALPTDLLGRVLGSGVLSAEQTRGLLAYHEAAGRLVAPAPAPSVGALAASGVAGLAGLVAGAAGAPAPAPAPPAPPADSVVLTRAQANAFLSVFQALFEASESAQMEVFGKMTAEKLEAFKEAFKQVGEQKG